jgi:hypothetical protein
MVTNILTAITVLFYSVIAALGLVVGYLVYLIIERVIRKCLTI